MAIELTDNQMHIAKELGWDDEEMLSEPVKCIIKRIEQGFSNKFSRDPITIKIMPAQTGSRSRRPFYALGNQSRFEVTRTYAKGQVHYDSNYEQLTSSAMLQLINFSLIKQLTGASDDQLMVYSFVDNIAGNVIVTPQNVMLVANCQNDVFIARSALSGAGSTAVASFDELVKDYVKIMMHAHCCNNTIHTHFYLTSKKAMDDIKQAPEKAQEYLETGAIKEYREVLITPNTVPMFASDTIKSKKGKNSQAKAGK